MSTHVPVPPAPVPAGAPPAHPAAPPGAAASAGRTLATAAGLVLVLAALVATLFTALGLPAAKSAPHRVPVGVAGPAPAVSAVASALAGQDADAFAVTPYADAGALRAGVLEREVYGGVVVEPSGPRILTASGGSPAVAAALSALATPLSGRSGGPVPVEDLVPLPADDPRGAGLAAAALPLTMAGLLPAILLSRAFRRRPWTAAGTAAVAALAVGGAVSALLHQPFGAVEANGWAVAGVVALGSAAISLPLLGLAALLGGPGLGLGAAVVVLLGTPLSGLASAPELLPAGWGAFGQLLPPGATGQLLRSAAYFDGAAASGPATVLTCWVLAGLLLLALAGARRARTGRRAGTAARTLPDRQARTGPAGVLRARAARGARPGTR